MNQMMVWTMIIVAWAGDTPRLDATLSYPTEAGCEAAATVVKRHKPIPYPNPIFTIMPLDAFCVSSLPHHQGAVQSEGRTP